MEETTDELVRRAAKAQINSLPVAIAALVVAAVGVAYMVLHDRKPDATGASVSTNWWPLFIAGAFIVLAISGLIRASSLHLQAVRETRRAPVTPAEPSVPPLLPPTPISAPALSPRDRRVVGLLPSSPDGRIYVERLPQEIAAPFFSTNHTVYQAGKLVADLRGKVVRWRLSVYEVSGLGRDMLVHSFAPVGDSEDVAILLHFDSEDVARVNHLEKNDVIDIEGVIDRIGGFATGISLVKCKLFASRRPSI